MKSIFAPGCALYHYKPQSIAAIFDFLQKQEPAAELYLTCCKCTEPSSEEMRIIVCCPGCSYKFEHLYPNAQIVSLWKVLSESDYPFPDYQGQRMAIHDSCHARHRNSTQMQVSARELCEKMHIRLSEPAHTRDDVHCCGASAADLETRRQMAHQLADEFSEPDVVVYCTGCTRSLSITKVHPRHLMDLLLEETTEGLPFPESQK